MIWPCVAAEGHGSPVFIDDVIVDRGVQSCALCSDSAKCCKTDLL